MAGNYSIARGGYASPAATAIAKRPPTNPRKALISEQQQLLQSLQQIITFSTTTHLDERTIRAFWKGDRRAQATMRMVDRLLQQSVSTPVAQIRKGLDQVDTLSLPELRQSDIRELFFPLSTIRPARSNAEPRHRAEQLQYAVELRMALLQCLWNNLAAGLTPPTSGVPLAGNRRQGAAFQHLIEALGTGTDETHKLVADLRVATRHYLGDLHDQFLELQTIAQDQGVSLPRRWTSILATGQERIYQHRHEQQERMEGIAAGNLNQSRVRRPITPPSLSSPKLSLPTPTRKHYVAGAMLLSLGGAALTQGHLASPASVAEASQSTSTENGLQQQIDDYFQRSSASPSRRVDRLVIGGAASMQRVLHNLTSFGYEASDVLEHVGASTLSAFQGLATLDMRWSAQGQPLVLPRAPDAPQAEVAPQAVRYLVNYQVQAGDTAQSIAEAHGLTVDQLLSESQLSESDIQPGRTFLVRAGAGVPQEALVKQSAQPAAATTEATPTHDATEVFSAGAIVPASRSAVVGDGTELAARYGSELYPSLEAMPADLNQYFIGSVQQVADFFNVRPGDILGILRAENNNAGYRVSQPATSSAGAKGVAQVVVRTWNGWSNPQESAHIRDMRSIEEHGGLGFDWALREEWRAWQNGSGDGSALANADADPNRFENGLSAIARHLVGMGLTRDVAERDPQGFRSQLADGIAIYNSGKPLSESASWTQSAANRKTVAQYVADAMAVSDSTPLNIATSAPAAVALGDVDAMAQQFVTQMESGWGVAVSETVLDRARGSEVAQQVSAGQLSEEAGAQQLVAAYEEMWLRAGQAAHATGQPAPWPYIYDEGSRQAQKLAVQYTGSPLAPTQLDALRTQGGGTAEAIEHALAARPDSRVVAYARQRLAEQQIEPTLQAVNDLLKPILNGQPIAQLPEDEVAALLLKVDAKLLDQSAPTGAQDAPITRFAATPLMPMPATFKGFGVKVDYQAGGTHTGIDVANPREAGQEPAIYAVDAGTVVHVGPLYCDVATACRGGNAIVLDHGNNLYSIYSHNSSASVSTGQQVAAGQEIGRQGNEGYSFGSHLHFEVHTGAPFSGNWEEPFHGGQFEDPGAWLPS